MSNKNDSAILIIFENNKKFDIFNLFHIKIIITFKNILIKLILND